MQLAVKAQWAQVLVLQMEQHVAQAQLKTSQENLNATRLRYQAGSIAQVDLDRQLMAHIENQRQAQQAQLNLTIAKQQLANLWGGDRASFQIDSESDKALLQTDDSFVVMRKKISIKNRCNFSRNNSKRKSRI